MFGARLVVARPGLHGDSGYLIDIITADRKITTLHFVPPMLSAFLTDKGAGKCVSLKRVICSGEALAHGNAAAILCRDCHGTELHNLYWPHRSCGGCDILESVRGAEFHRERGADRTARGQYADLSPEQRIAACAGRRGR